MLLLTTFGSQQAKAQCVPGAPCIGGGTDYDAADPADTSNDIRTDSDACDGNFMNQIYARAFMEVQRENLIAQTYIRKPDSVLEYSCIDQIIGQVRPHATSLFSSSTFWSGTNIPLNIAYTAAGNPTSIPIQVNMGPTHIVAPLNNIVGSALNAFVNTNYNHDFLGGTATGVSSSIGASIPSGAYTCSAMSAVWDLAKCQNFDTTPDLFLSFEDLEANDPRQFPVLAGCVTDITTDLIETARNDGPAYETAMFDPIDPFTALLLPATSNADCTPPIETGLEIVVRNYTLGAETTANPSGVTEERLTIPEKVCINPGCYYFADITWGGSPTLNSDECRDG